LKTQLVLEWGKALGEVEVAQVTLGSFMGKQFTWRQGQERALPQKLLPMLSPRGWEGLREARVSDK